MSNRSTLKLGFEKKAWLTMVGILDVTIPIILGVTNASALCAQSGEKFEVAAVRRVEFPPTDGGVPRVSHHRRRSHVGPGPHYLPRNLAYSIDRRRL